MLMLTIVMVAALTGEVAHTEAAGVSTEAAVISTEAAVVSMEAAVISTEAATVFAQEEDLTAEAVSARLWVFTGAPMHIVMQASVQAPGFMALPATMVLQLTAV
jgi:hypothetical protein